MKTLYIIAFLVASSSAFGQHLFLTAPRVIGEEGEDIAVKLETKWIGPRRKGVLRFGPGQGRFLGHDRGQLSLRYRFDEPGPAEIGPMVIQYGGDFALTSTVVRALSVPSLGTSTTVRTYAFPDVTPTNVPVQVVVFGRIHRPVPKPYAYAGDPIMPKQPLLTEYTTDTAQLTREHRERNTSTVERDGILYATESIVERYTFTPYRVGEHRLAPDPALTRGRFPIGRTATVRAHKRGGS